MGLAEPNVVSLPGTSAAPRGVGAFAEHDGLLLGESVSLAHQ